MLRYRALLIDTAGSYERPVQQFFNDIEQATDWAKKTLAVAHEHATVVFYRTQEEEIHSLSKEDFNDKAAVQGIQQASKKAS